MLRHLLAEQVTSLLAIGHARQALELVRSGLADDPNDIELLNIAGICAASLEDPGDAERYWRQAIASAPDTAQVHYNLGLLQGKLNRTNEAEQSYRKAIGLDPGNGEAHNNLGLLLAKCRQKTEAESCYRRAIGLDPGNSRAYSNLGILLAADNRREEAETCYRQALALQPEEGEILCNLGVLLASQRRDEEALQCYGKAIELDPGNAAAFSNLGIFLAVLKRVGEAEQCYRRAILLDPGNAKAHSNLGLLLEQIKRADEALECHRKASALDPCSAEIHSNLANLLASSRRWDEAEACYRQAIDLDPNGAALHSNLGVMLANCRRETEAEHFFRQAIALNANYQLARLNLGFLLLRQARFDEGWACHEARFNSGLPDNGIPSPQVGYPRWQGEALAGKSLLVWSEQGFGDQIQFCRYAPLLKEQGAAHIALVCRKPLKTLMESLAGVDAVLSTEDAKASRKAYDYWTLPLSIPLYCKTRLENIPARIPYLSAPPDRIGQWARQLPHGQFNVALVWKGNAHHHNDGYRSLPSLSTLSPLWSVPGVRFLSLQKGHGEDGAINPPENQPLSHLGSDISDFSDTAAIIALVDLVICVDTAVAHLAGALGKACWVLLPAYRSDWRWLHDRDDSPWYPDRMRLFRQQGDEDWAAVIADIEKALHDEVLNHSHQLRNTRDMP